MACRKRLCISSPKNLLTYCFVIILLAIASIYIWPTLHKLNTNNQLYRHHFLHFGTIIQITTTNQDPKLQNITIDSIDKLLETLHTKWHPWRDGELKKLNTNLQSQQSFKAQPEIIRIIQQCQKLYISSHGYFNPAIGKLVNFWGFHNDIPEGKRNKAIDYQALIKQLPTPSDITITDNIIQNTNPFLQLDLSGIIKADAMLQIKQILKNNNISNAIINIGGDIYVMGTKANDRAWTIAAPTQAKSFLKLKLNSNESVATSGTSQRNYTENKTKLRHHIIDPTTFEPATGFDTVTVIHQNPYISDAAATALLIAGQKNYQKVALSMGIDKYLLVDKDQIILSEDMQKRIERK